MMGRADLSAGEQKWETPAQVLTPNSGKYHLGLREFETRVLTDHK